VSIAVTKHFAISFNVKVKLSGAKCSGSDLLIRSKRYGRVIAAYASYFRCPGLESWLGNRL